MTGSLKSLVWALDHGALTLAVHTVLGVLLAFLVIDIAARSFRFPRRSLAWWSVLGALFTVGAGFNGASFLDYNKNVSSFIMTVLALGALACFFIVLYALPRESVRDVTT